MDRSSHGRYKGLVEMSTDLRSDRPLHFAQSCGTECNILYDQLIIYLYYCIVCRLYKADACVTYYKYMCELSTCVL